MPLEHIATFAPSPPFDRMSLDRGRPVLPATPTSAATRAPDLPRDPRAPRGLARLGGRQLAGRLRPDRPASADHRLYRALPGAGAVRAEEEGRVDLGALLPDLLQPEAGGPG